MSYFGISLDNVKSLQRMIVHDFSVGLTREDIYQSNCYNQKIKRKIPFNPKCKTLTLLQKMILLDLLSSLKYSLPFNFVNWMETVDTFLDANNVPHSELFPLSMVVHWDII